MDLLAVLIAQVCLISSPGECKQVRFVQDIQTTSQQMLISKCNRRALPLIAKWAGDHPRWRVKRFWCVSEHAERIDI